MRARDRRVPTMNYQVDPDITAASTLPGRFYADAQAWHAARERVFARSWQWVGDVADVESPNSLAPRMLLPGLLDEPLLLVSDASGERRCLSNVCTHRGNLLVSAACRAEAIRCGYHSRRFDLSGRMTFMPEFQGVRNFPAASDDLARIPFATWAGHAFAALDPVMSFEQFIGDVAARTSDFEVADWRASPARSRDYTVNAHWALYVENYLEGFHIPFVHADLNAVVDYRSYATELFRYAVCQVALAKPGESAFNRSGDRVAAYYWWLFPNLMLNFYPWGLSVNLVEPQAVDRTRIAFRSFVADESLLGRGAGGDLDRVEAEDEAIVEAVAQGVRSRFYSRGRYSPARERGVHHFHRLLCEFMADDAPG